MILPNWSVVKYNPVDETYLCSDRVVRTAEELHRISMHYDNMLQFEQERFRVGIYNTAIVDKKHHGGIFYTWM